MMVGQGGGHKMYPSIYQRWRRNGKKREGWKRSIGHDYRGGKIYREEREKSFEPGLLPHNKRRRDRELPKKQYQ